MAAPTNQDWFARLAALLRRDPRKTTLVTFLAAVMIVLWGRLLFTGPSPAAASLVKALQSVTSPGLSPVAPRQTAGSALIDWLNEKKRSDSRNLFAVNFDYFPKEGRKNPVSAAGGSTDDNPGFWDDMAKSLASAADHKRERQILVENLQAQASTLKLQSTVMSVPPRALVNGELVGEGNMVEAFRVLKIEPRRIVVEQNGVRLEISMD